MKYVAQILGLGFISCLLLSCGDTKPAAKAQSNIEHSNNNNQAENKGDDMVAAMSQPLYLRGAFNGWGTSTEFQKLGDTLVAEIDVTIGNHAFKVAPDDWSQEWVINPNEGQIAKLNTDLPLYKGKAPEDFLLSSQPGRYRFEITLTKQPTLHISHLGDITQAFVNPHEDTAEVYVSEYAKAGSGHYQASYSIQSEQGSNRTYLHASNQALRDPGNNYLRYSEQSNLPKIRTGDLEFDALFALAVNEMGYLSVDTINDSAYNKGEDIDCACFKTGQKWAYVWTRDLSYAADLSLAFLDPDRVKNSLNFKLSEFRPEVTANKNVQLSGLQIIQDTGSGGSWPISTDRMTWALGAEKALNNLPAKERSIFAPRAYQALVNSITADRQVAFDVTDGLYQGEQSFLDWREQTYAPWIVEDLSTMASAKALSTNVSHYQALRLAGELALEFNEPLNATKFNQWADELKGAINKKLWLPSKGLYSSLTAGHFDGAVMAKFDWLGQSLAIVSGIASEQQTQAILNNYPHGPMGAPVIFPQQPDAPVYHNRAIWPFVTSYGLKAAKLAKHTAVANAAMDTLIRTAALNLSNMENLEWLTAQPMYLDEARPKLSGPVINSNYQLWSVAGYLNLVVENVFGLTTTKQGLTVSPFITTALRNKRFAEQEVISLNNMAWLGKSFNVDIKFPVQRKSTAQGYYSIESVLLNGESVSTAISAQELTAGSVITVQLGKVIEDNSRLTAVSSQVAKFDKNVYAPRTPKVQKAITQEGGLKFILEPTDSDNHEVKYNLYKDGQLILERVEAGKLIAPNSASNSCFSISSSFTSGTQSHHSKPICFGNAQQIFANDKRITSNKAVSAASDLIDATHIANFGAPTDTLTISDIAISEAGQYSIQFEYVNASNSIGQGVTNGVKQLVISNNNKVIPTKIIQLPHTLIKQGKSITGLSTPAIVDLTPGTLSIDVNDFFNMSYLSSNSTYGSAGGKSGPRNHFDFISVKVMKLNK